MNDKFVLHEFHNDDTLDMGGIILTRIKNEEATITNDITGVYINKSDKTLCVSIIKNKNGDYGFLEWGKSGGDSGGITDVFEMSVNKIVFKTRGSADFIFERAGNDIIEIGSSEIKGSNLTYTKINNLTYSSQVDITVRDDGYLLRTTEFGGYEWYILKQESDKQLLFAKNAVASLEGDDIGKNEWADNYIRQYLNNDFYNSFSSADKNKILSTHNKNEAIASNGIREATATDDKIFLLNNSELSEYLSFNDELICKYNNKLAF